MILLISSSVYFLYSDRQAYTNSVDKDQRSRGSEYLVLYGIHGMFLACYWSFFFQYSAQWKNHVKDLADIYFKTEMTCTNRELSPTLFDTFQN